MKKLVGSNFNFKNRVVNGDFLVWQRGESFTTAGYTADRFRFDTDTDDNITISKVDNKTFNSYKFSITTAGTTGTYNKVATRLEFPYDFNNKTFTLSFKVKASAAVDIKVGNKFVISETDTDDKNTTISVGTTFETKTYTFTNTDITSQTVDNSTDYFEIYFLLPINIDIEIEIAEIQLEKGNIATEFEYIPYDLQLQKCLRYYESNLNAGFPVSIGDTGAVYNQTIFFLSTKRITPTVTFYDADNKTAGKIKEGGPNVSVGAYDVTGIKITKTFMTEIDTGNNDSDGKYAEFYYTADAEL